MGIPDPKIRAVICHHVENMWNLLCSQVSFDERSARDTNINVVSSTNAKSIAINETSADPADTRNVSPLECNVPVSCDFNSHFEVELVNLFSLASLILLKLVFILGFLFIAFRREREFRIQLSSSIILTKLRRKWKKWGKTKEIRNYN